MAMDFATLGEAIYFGIGCAGGWGFAVATTVKSCRSRVDELKGEVGELRAEVRALQDARIAELKGRQAAANRAVDESGG